MSVNNSFLSRSALAAAFCSSAVSTFQEYSICIHHGNPRPQSWPTGKQHACLPCSSLAVTPESLWSQFTSVPATTQDFYIVWNWDLGRWIPSSGLRKYRFKSGLVPEDRLSLWVWGQSGQQKINKQTNTKRKEQARGKIDLKPESSLARKLRERVLVRYRQCTPGFNSHYHKRNYIKNYLLNTTQIICLTKKIIYEIVYSKVNFSISNLSKARVLRRTLLKNADCPHWAFSVYHWLQSGLLGMYPIKEGLLPIPSATP